MHGLFVWVMQTSVDMGYLGVLLLMALESSIVPVPSELIIPPAAYWAAQGRLSLAGVLLAGACGSWLGSSICYWLSAWIGRPIVTTAGRYIGITEEKVAGAEAWVNSYGTGGIFFSRLLPVVRHLISIPAGILRMNFLKFSLMTVLGAGLWSLVLAFFGTKVITPEMLSDNPNVVLRAVKDQMHWIVLLIVVIAGLYGIMRWFMARAKGKDDDSHGGSSS